MSKTSTFPPLYNEVLQMNSTKLKKWRYFEAGQTKSGTLNWSLNGTHTASISIRADMIHQPPYIELDYKYFDEPRKYKVQITSTPSNLCKGEIWYFICPITKKRCRKLYSIGGYFLHREAFNGCMYESQTQSKKYRELTKNYGALFENESIYETINSKHFKKTYAGKPTKKYLKLIQRIEQNDQTVFALKFRI